VARPITGHHRSRWGGRISKLVTTTHKPLVTGDHRWLSLSSLCGWLSRAGVFAFIVSRRGVCVGDHRWLSLSSLCGGSLAREFSHSLSRAEVFALVVWRWSLGLRGFTLNLREVHAFCGGVLVSGFWRIGSPEKVAYFVESEGV
jgi:hypothetical protein